MNPLNLLWIVPLSCSAGAFVMAIFAGRKTMELTHCKDCVWNASVDSNPTAKEIHDILDSGNEVGICRKLTYTEDRPVLTRPDGYCHRAERREADE